MRALFRTKSRGSPTQARRIRAGQEGGKAPEATLQATELKVLSSQALMGRGFVSHLSVFKMLQLFLALGLKETEGFLVKSVPSPHAFLHTLPWILEKPGPLTLPGGRAAGSFPSRFPSRLQSVNVCLSGLCIHQRAVFFSFLRKFLM